jgi:fatty-acyl-CoA synthase
LEHEIRAVPETTLRPSPPDAVGDVKGRPQHVTLLVGSILQRAAALSPRSVAASLDERSVTFEEVHGRANQAAHALDSLGLVPGERIASWTDISLRSLDLFFGAARLGAAFCPLNPSLSPGETIEALSYLRPRLLVTDWAHMHEAADVARQLQLTLAVTGSRHGTVPGLDLDAITRAAAVDDPTRPEPATDQAHVIFLTSGSTGRPKGVVLSHYASWMRAVPLGGATRLVASGGGGDLCPFPLFHMAGWNALLCQWALLRPIHLVQRADGDHLLAAIERWRPSSLYCIPAVWRRVFDSVTTKHDLSSLRYAITGTSLVSEELLLEIKDRLPGTETTISYGSTEMGVATTLGDHDLFARPGSIGRPNPGFDAAIVEGELCLRGETAMSGYFDLADETASVFVDGWYRSGDLADMDDEGYLRITGRRREIIRSGGETVAPSEVEAAIASFPGVREVGVVGLPDQSWGEIVCAVVVLDEGAPMPAVESLRAYLGSGLATFKHPRLVARVDVLPRTAATGQIQRGRLRQSLLDRQGLA